MTGVPIDWLLTGDPWVAYRTWRDLLQQPDDTALVQSTRTAMVASPQVRDLIAGLADWPGTVIASHKSAGQPFHRLTFLADLGLTVGDPGVATIVERVFTHQSPEGPYLLPTQIAENHGGSGGETRAWALCDAPLIVYALAKLGLGQVPAVRRAVDHLVGLVKENGWPCAVSKELGTFRGPGRKDDPCPFATLAMLKALSAFEDLREGEAARIGAETLLFLWANSRTQHPYIFHMGTDFRKLKVPFVWYDLLHVLDVLSQFPWLGSDPRMRAMVAVLEAKMDTQGRFTPESVWTAWRGWEFAQKKSPSRWTTFAAWRILTRTACLAP